MISRNVIEHRFTRDAEHMILQFLQRAHTLDNLMRLRVTEKEITESHVLLHCLTQIHAYLLRVLVDEHIAFLP